jgi:hypothetical protein
MLGDGESGLRYSSSSGAALKAAVMMGGPPPSNDSMQVVSIPWVDGASLGGNGSSVGVLTRRCRGGVYIGGSYRAVQRFLVSANSNLKIKSEIS